MNAQLQDPPVGDPTIETWLADRHVTFTYQPALPVADIDQARSLANQARLEALDGDVVDRYQADMERGDEFPPLLGLARKRARPVLLGGNHRLAAHVKAGHATVPVYLVTCEPEMATRLMYEDNRRHGLPPSDAERIAQGVHLMDIGWTQTAAAECVGVSSNKLARARAVTNADRRARENKVDGWADIPKSVKARLDSVRSDPVFAKACAVVTAVGLDTNQVYELVTKVNDARSDKTAFELLDLELEARRSEIQAKAQGNSTRLPPTAKTRLLSGLGHMAGVSPVEVAAGCANAEQARSLARQIVDTQARLKQVLAELKARW